MTKKFNRGFTLIELLIVIAIIGILSAVVLAALTSARGRGADAGVKSNLVNARSQADLYFSNNDSYGTYSGTCPTTTAGGSGTVFGDATIVSAVNSAVAAGGNGTRCVSVGTAYAIAVGMKTAGLSWCVDSLSRSRQYTGTPAAAVSVGGACN